MVFSFFIGPFEFLFALLQRLSSDHMRRLVTGMIVPFLILAMVRNTEGQDQNWRDGIDGDWETAGNWISGDIADTITETAVFGGFNAYGVQYRSNYSIGGLDITNTQASIFMNTLSGNTSLTVDSGVTNQGVIELNSNNAFDVTLTINNGSFINHGTVTFGGTATGSSTIRSLQADLINHGTLNVFQDAFLNRNNTNTSNNGTINIAAGKTLSFGGATATFHQISGTINNNGSFLFESDTLNFNGGTITGNAVQLNNSRLDIGATGTGAAMFDMTGTSTFEGTLVSGQTLSLLGNSGNTTVTATEDILNQSTINLLSDTNFDVQLVRSGNITNQGTINFGGASTDPATIRSLQANLLNQGTININQDAQFSQNQSATTNESGINIAAGRRLHFGGANVTFNQDAGFVDNLGSFEFSSDTLNFNGGQLLGNSVNMLNSNLNIGAGNSGIASFTMQGTGTMSGDLADTQLLDLNTQHGGNTVITLQGDMMNDSIISLDSDTALDVTIAGGHTVTNTGVINFGGTSTDSATIRQIQNNLVNQGVVNVNQDARFSLNGGTVTNSQELHIASGKTLDFGGANITFNQNAGELENLGAFEFSSDTLNFNGGNITGNAIRMQNSNLNIANSNVGAGSFVLQGTGTMSGDLANTQLLEINTANGTNAAITLNSDLTNDSVLQVNSDSNRDVTLFREGTITNRNQIILGGASDDVATLRNIQATLLDNQGTIEVNQNARFSKNGSTVLNQAHINIASGKTLSFGGANLTFNQTAGQIDNQGTFEFSSDTLNYTGGNFTGNAIDLNNSNLAIGPGHTGTGSFVMTGTGTFDGDLANTQFLDVNTGLGGAVVTFLSDFTNDSTINLDSDTSSDVTLVRNGLFTNNGEINFGGSSTASNTVRQIQSNMVNHGSINLNQNGRFNQNGSSFSNHGQVNIAAGRTMDFGGANVIFSLESGGTVNNLGEFLMSSDTLNFNGGNFTGNQLDLINSTLNIANGNVGTGSFQLRGTGTYSGDLANTQFLDLNTSHGGGTSITATTDFTNHSIINLDSDSSSDVTLVRNGKIINQGVFNFGGSASGLNTIRNLSADFDNHGIFNVNQYTRLGRNTGVFTNTDTVNIAAGKLLDFGGANGTFVQSSGEVSNLGAFEFSSDTLDFRGGDLNGNAIELVNSNLIIGVGSTGNGDFLIRGTSSLQGDVASAQSIVVDTMIGGATLNAVDDFTSQGRIELNSDNASDVRLQHAGRFTNDGIVQFGGAAGGSNTLRTLATELFNYGIVDVAVESAGTIVGRNSTNHENHGQFISQHQATNIDFLGDSFLNSSTGNLQGIGEFDFSQTGLLNQGALTPGLSAGEMVLDGMIDLDSTSQLMIELGGTIAAIEHDLITVLDSIALDGSLDVSFIDGFHSSIQSTDTFSILTGTSVTGQFDGITEGGLLQTSDGRGYFQVNYAGNQVTLSNFSPVPEPGVLMVLWASMAIAVSRRRRTI